MDSWILGRRWNVVQTAPNSEALAACSASELGWGVFWPRYREKRVRPRRKTIDAIVPYLPGYIFVEAQRYSRDGRPLSPWELSKAKGVTSVIKVGDEHAMVDDTDPVMQTLLKMADDEGFVTREIATRPITMFKTGDRIIVDDGPFRSFPGIVHEISKNRKIAQVWVQLFGRPTNVELHIEQMKPVKPAKSITKAA